MTGLVLLAAGRSARMGTPKQLLRFGGRSLLRGAAEEALASGCSPVVVVLGAFARRLKLELAELPVRIVTNEAWREGMGGSIRVGMDALLSQPDGDPVDAAVLMVCDQPFCTATHLRRLVVCHQQLKGAAVASSYGGVRGVPALFSRPLFAELLELRGPEGARRILQSHAYETWEIPFPAGAMDIDTPKDHARSL